MIPRSYGERGAPLGVVARWAAHAPAGPDVRCAECGARVEPTAVYCDGCGQVPSQAPRGRMAVVIDTTAGRRLVIAERTPDGGWTAARTQEPTGETVRMLRRQDITRSAS